MSNFLGFLLLITTGSLTSSGSNVHEYSVYLSACDVLYNLHEGKCQASRTRLTLVATLSFEHLVQTCGVAGNVNFFHQNEIVLCLVMPIVILDTPFATCDAPCIPLLLNGHECCMTTHICIPSTMINVLCLDQTPPFSQQSPSASPQMRMRRAVSHLPSWCP